MCKVLSAPLAMQVEITDNCNQSCSHCYRSCPEIRKKGSIKLGVQAMDRIVDQLVRWNVLSVAFTGGEPLIYEKVVKHGIERARSGGLDCCLNSNLQILPEGMAEFLAEHRVRVLTSLLSCDPDLHDRMVQKKGAFKKLMSNIEILVSAGVLMSINTVVRKENAHQIYDIGMLAHKLRAQRFSATKAAPTHGVDYGSYRASPDQIKESLDVMLRIHEETGMFVDILESYPLCFFGDLDKYAIFIRRNCTAGIFNCSISPDGTVRPCSHADMSYGNLLEQSLQECWYAMQDWRDGSYLNEKCRTCKFLLQCTGGCRMDAKLLCGDIKGQDPLMTCPEDVISTVTNISTERTVVPPDFLRVSSSVRIRKESFGGIAKKGDDVVYLNDSGYEALTNLKEVEFFQWRELCFTGVKQRDVFDFVAKMWEKRFFKGA